MGSLDQQHSFITIELVDDILQQYNPLLKLEEFKTNFPKDIGTHFLSVIYGLDIKAKNTVEDGQQEEELLKIILKTLPQNEHTKKMINEKLAFAKEAEMYGKIFPSFVSFQLENSINEIFEFYPTCYALKIDRVADYFAMENLLATGYKMLDREDGLDEDHINLLLKTLGKFHALSYTKFKGNYTAIKSAHPILFQNTERFMLPSMQTFAMKCFKSNAMALRKAGYEHEAKIMEKVCHKDIVFNKLNHLLSEDATKHCVISHADLWNCNVMYKYSKNTGKPIAVKMFDYQTVQITSRTIDILFLLFLSTKDDILNTKELDFLRTYYNSFAVFAKELGYLPDELTFEQLLDEYYNEFYYYGIVIALMKLHFVYSKAKVMEGLDSIWNEDSYEQLFSRMANEKIVEKLRNVINAHVPKLNIAF